MNDRLKTFNFSECTDITFETKSKYITKGVKKLYCYCLYNSACLAQRYLSETLNVLGKLGCTLCILGSTVLVIHAPQESDVQSMDELYYRITSLGV